MQLDQPGEVSLANTPLAHIPRSRPGARGAMRATNRYTMPPLVPRLQQGSTIFQGTQGQQLAASTSHIDMDAPEPLLPADEDAWLNDVLPPAPVRLDNPPGRITARDRAPGEDGVSARVAPILLGHRLWPVVHRLSEHVCQELARGRTVVEGIDAELEELVRRRAMDMLRAEPALSGQIYNLTEAEQVMRAVVDEVSGFGPLAALVRDKSVTEIMAVGPRLTVIERDGDMQEVRYYFEDERHMTRIVGNMLSRAGRTFDPSVAITSARLPDGTFINVVMPPGAVNGPTITIRKRRQNVPTLAELVRFETLSQPMADFLDQCVQTRLNIVICGGQRSGRTTLLNALAACIPAAERIVTLEDVAELQLKQKQVVSFEARLIDSDNKNAHEHGNSGSMRELLLCALRMRPERVIMGDCWNDEAAILLSALHSGYDGSLFTVYANGLQDCLSRLEMMWLASRSGAPLSIIREQLARAVHLMVYLARLSNGSRKVMNIAQVVGVQGDRIKARSIFHYQENSEGRGRFESGRSVSSFLNSSR
jgi:pilus assembly protein CpaF